MRNKPSCRSLGLVLVSCALGATSVWAAARDVQHPFLLWTREEAAALKKRIETDELAKQQYERMVKVHTGSGKGAGFAPLLNLFKYSVLGDEAAGEAEKKGLLGFFGRRPPESVPGNPNTGNAPYRDDHWLDGLRYDVLYGALTDEQRRAYLDTVNNYMQWFRTKYGPWRRCPEQGTPRTGWLPNMQYPTVSGLHVLVAATGDEKLIKEVFDSPGGLKWWLDVYVADEYFYMEEFGKYGAMVTAQLLWCEGLERLGLPQYGYGYTGQKLDMPGHAGGATMRKFLGSLIRAGYPRILRGDAMPEYPCVNMGDAGSKSIVSGVNADGSGGTPWCYAATMWGQPKLMQAFWWEVGAKRFPEDGYDYFLAQMRAPGEELYLPSLFCGLAPIDPNKVKAPPAPSYVAPERGFALLRAEESPAYWESPQPAVGFQFGMYYVHYVHDCFSILQYVADNRFIYNKMGHIWGGYAGGDPARDSVRGQGSGVTVDCLQVTPVDSGDEGCKNERLRQLLTPAAKFAAVRAQPRVTEQKDKDGNVRQLRKELYPDVDAERALVLTSEYLFDVYWLKSDRDRLYDWHVQGGGQIAGAAQAPWADSTDLGDNKFWAPSMTTQKNKRAPDPSNVRKRTIGEAAWTETLLQGGEGDKTVGVRVAMLPEKGTTLYTFALPAVDPAKGATLMARRTAPGTTFVALHEPFQGGPDGYKVARFERIAQSDQGVAVAIIGKDGSGIDDRILFRYGDDHDKPLTLAGNGESFTFCDYAYMRVGKERVTVDGQVSAMKLRVARAPKLVLNGKETGASAGGGFLELK